jgi:hypothetical protein
MKKLHEMTNEEIANLTDEEYDKLVSSDTIEDDIDLTTPEVLLEFLNATIDNITNRFINKVRISETQQRRYNAKAQICKEFIRNNSHYDIVSRYTRVYNAKHNTKLTVKAVCDIIIKYNSELNGVLLLGYLDYIRTEIKQYIKVGGNPKNVLRVIDELESLDTPPTVKELEIILMDLYKE